MKNIFLFSIILLNCFAVKAQPGQLDPTFGANGILSTTALLGTNSFIIQPDGKILAGGNAGLARYNADATPDISFNGTGIRNTSFSVGAIALQPDGKIVVAGTAANDFVVARFNTDGSIDNSFSGDGIHTTDYETNSIDRATSIVIQQDGKIILAGKTTYNSLLRLVLIRYNHDGSIDNSYNNNGKINTGLFQDTEVRFIALQSDGKLVVAGSASGPSGFPDFAVNRYNTNGTPDKTFGDNGMQLIDFGEFDLGTSVAIQHDGKIVIAGWLIYIVQDISDACVARLNSDGSPDSSFSGDGKAIAKYDDYEGSYDVVIQDDGKIITGGTWLLRYNPDGTLDDGFGINGGYQSASEVKKLIIDNNKLYALGFGEITRHLLGGVNVNITSPAQNTVFDSPGPIDITVSATNPDGTIEKVELYNGQQLIGTDFTSPYSFTFTNAINTDYEFLYLTAKATDNLGNVTSSPLVRLIEQTPKPIIIDFIYPNDNASFGAPANIKFQVSADDPSSGSGVNKVEFFNGSTFLGLGYRERPGSREFIFEWKNIPEGSYVVTAKATNTTGRTATTLVHVFIGANKPPYVYLISPGGNEVYAAPANISFQVYAIDDNAIANVEYYNGNDLIGSNPNYPYNFTWKNVPVGKYDLTARATDNGGLTVTSFPVHVSVVVPEVSSFSLINADADKSIQLIPDGSIIDLNTLPTRNLNIRANTTSKRVGSVVFMLDGKKMRTENGRPYSLAGDFPSGDYHAWNLPLGDHVLTAIPYSNYNAKGQEGKSLTIHFTVVNSHPLVSANSKTNSLTERFDYTLYPNPAGKILYVTSKGLPFNNKITISIVSMSGAVLKTIQTSNRHNTIGIDVSSITPGTYFIKMKVMGRDIYKTFIKM